MRGRVWRERVWRSVCGWDWTSSGACVMVGCEGGSGGGGGGGVSVWGCVVREAAGVRLH